MIESQMERKLTAFYVFATDGIERVKSMFPEQVEFVEANAEKSYDDVKAELMALLGNKDISV